MTDSYDEVYFFETDNSGVDYACYKDLVNSSDPLFDDDMIECVEVDLEDFPDDLDFDD